MASNIKVDVVRPTATNGSLSLKGDSGGSATPNGVTVNSSGNTNITGTTTVSSLVATTADINGGTIDGTEIGSNSSSTGIFSSAAIGTSISSTAKLNFNISNSDPTVSAIDAIKNMAGPSADNENIAQFYGFDTGIGDTGIEICNKGTGGLNTNSAKALAVKADGSDALVVTGTGRVDISTSAKIDTINEYTSATGVTVDGVLLKDGVVNVNTINDFAGIGAPDFPNGLTLNSSTTLDGVASTSEINGTHTTGSVTSGTTALTVASGTGISNGDYIVGEGITPGTTVSSGGGTTSITMSANANATLSSDPVSFYPATKVLTAGNVAGMLCRAWVNFYGGPSTHYIRASRNVSSIADNGTGSYTVNFTTAMPDANYAFAANAASQFTNNVPLYAGQDSDDTKSTTALQIRTVYNNAIAVNLSDSPDVNVVIFR